MESRCDELLPQINERLLAAYSAPDRSVMQQAAYIEALTLIEQVTATTRDFTQKIVGNAEGDMVPYMEQMGYDFEASARLLLWDREKWREHLKGLKRHFEAQVEYFGASEEAVRKELERIDAGVAKKFVVQRDEDGNPVAVYAEGEESEKINVRDH